MLDSTRGYLHPFLNGRTYLYGVGEQPRTVSQSSDNGVKGEFVGSA